MKIYKDFENIFFFFFCMILISFLAFIKKETLAQVFSCEFCEISKNTFSYRTTPTVASGKRCVQCGSASYDKHKQKSGIEFLKF